MLDIDNVSIKLRVPTYTELKLYAYLFSDKYSLVELKSIARTPSYLGESGRFFIDDDTKSEEVTIVLKSL